MTIFPALMGYSPKIVHSLMEAMVEWRRCELDNQMAALGAEEVRAHAQLAEPYPAVRFVGAVVATSARPNLLLTLTIGAWL